MRRPLTPVLLALALAGCHEPETPPAGWLEALRAAPTPGPGDSWPLAPEAARVALESAPMRLLEIERTEAGTTGAYRAEVRLGDRDVTVKWKTASGPDADAFNNTPRKEMAAYEVQTWFLDEVDYLVPPVTMRCLPKGELARVGVDAEPQIEGTDCVLGAVSLWLDDLEVPDAVYEPERFYAEAPYATHLADFNLFTLLVQHRDGATHNVLVSSERDNRRVFAIDNGITFGGALHNVFVRNWDSIRVPALRRSSVERLRAVKPSQIEALGELAVLVREGRGLRLLREGEDRAGVDVALVLGLTERERAHVAERRERLLRRTDAGELPLF